MLNLGDVYFSVKNQVSETSRSCDETEAVVGQMRDRISKPIVVPVTTSVGGGGGAGAWGGWFGGGGSGSGSYSNPAPSFGGGGGGPGGTTFPGYGIGSSAPHAFTGFTPTSSAPGWGVSSAGLTGGSFSAGGMFDDAIASNQNAARQREVQNSLIAMEQKAQSDLFHQGRAYYAQQTAVRELTQDRRGSVSGALMGMEQRAFAARARQEEDINDEIDDSGASEAQRRFNTGGMTGWQEPTAPRGNRMFGIPIGRGIGAYVVAGVGIHAMGAGVQGLAAGITGSRLQATARGSYDPYQELDAVMANRQQEQAIEGQIPFGIGAAIVAGRQLHYAMAGEDEGTLNALKGIGSTMLTSTQAIAAQRRQYQGADIVLNNQHNASRRELELMGLRHTDELAAVAEPYNARKEALNKDYELSKSLGLTDDDDFGALVKSLAGEDRARALAQNRRRSQQGKETLYATQQVAIGSQEIVDQTRAMGFGLDAISQGKRELFDVTAAYNRQLNMPGGVDDKDRAIVTAQANAAVQLQERKNKQTEQLIQIDAEQITRHQNAATYQSTGMGFQARLEEFRAAEAQADQFWRTEQGNTPAGYAARGAAIMARKNYEEIEMPREMRQELQPLIDTGRGLDMQKQSAQAYLNRDFRKANLLTAEGSAYGMVDAALRDIDKTYVPAEIQQKQKNLASSVELMALQAQTSLSRGYNAISKNVYEDVQAGYRNEGKEINLGELVKVLHTLNATLSRDQAKMGAGKGYVLIR